MSLPKSTVILTLIVLLASTSHQSTPPCIVQLVPCYQFLNATNVSDSCCKSVRDAVANQKGCLCKLYQTPGILQTYNINITQVFGLTKACGVEVAVTTFCADVSAQSPSTVPAAVPGKDQNAGEKKTPWAGLFAIQMFVASFSVMIW